jgi:hypothetical protein
MVAPGPEARSSVLKRKSPYVDARDRAGLARARRVRRLMLPLRLRRLMPLDE